MTSNLPSPLELPRHPNMNSQLESVWFFKHSWHISPPHLSLAHACLQAEGNPSCTWKTTCSSFTPPLRTNQPSPQGSGISMSLTACRRAGSLLSLCLPLLMILSGHKECCNIQTKTNKGCDQSQWITIKNWANSLNFLSLRLLICKTEIILCTYSIGLLSG